MNLATIVIKVHDSAVLQRNISSETLSSYGSLIKSTENPQKLICFVYYITS